VSERDDNQHLAVGAGTPADPDPPAQGPSLAGDDGPAPADSTSPAEDTSPASNGEHTPTHDAIEAVAAFVEDLVVETGVEETGAKEAGTEEAGTEETGTEENAAG
jgi:hypothetical protein